MLFLILGFIFLEYKNLNKDLFIHHFYNLFTFTPYITLLNFQISTFCYKKIFRSEPFSVDKHGLSHGIWVKNRGNVANRTKYAVYSLAIQFFTFVPFIILVIYFKNKTI